MMKRKTGEFECSTAAGEKILAFIPYPLPPKAPPLRCEGTLALLLTKAQKQLGLLNLAGDLVPSVDWFVHAFVRKEAVLSSQLEGTQATLMDLLEVEALDKCPRNADIEEICSYVDALNFAWSELDSEAGLPISMRLLSKTHRRLLANVRGAQKQPGEIRKSQNWIGEDRASRAIFVPPPPHHLKRLLSEFEHAVHSESDLPPLIRIGLLHAQFETLHPYLDGNGRLGRLLITLLLRHWGLLSQPLLYLSLFLKTHRAEYYQRLNAVRSDGDWEGWLEFFLEGVSTVAYETVATARHLHAIVTQGRARILSCNEATILSLRLFEMLPSHPILMITQATDLLQCSRPAATKAMQILESLHILQPLDERKRNRVLIFKEYLDHLRKGTDALL